MWTRSTAPPISPTAILASPFPSRSLMPGRFEGFWEFGLKPWDSAAGVLLVEEAGGRVSSLDGQPYDLSGPSLLATNGLVHEEMLRVAAEIAQRDPSAPFPR